MRHNIPIFIINKDRLQPLRQLVEFLQNKNYNIITIVDNNSTYIPLLEWYPKSGANIFYNKCPDTTIDSLNSLAYVYKIEEFYKPMTSGNFVFSDSDIVPINEIPNDFIDHMAEICNYHKKHKVGLGLKIDDIPDHFYNKEKVLSIEGELLYPQDLIPNINDLIQNYIKKE